MSKLKFQTNMSAYENMEFWELHAIQKVHINDYVRVKGEIELLQSLLQSESDEREKIQREIDELFTLKTNIYKVISDFGILLDSLDGTRRI